MASTGTTTSSSQPELAIDRRRGVGRPLASMGASPERMARAIVDDQALGLAAAGSSLTEALSRFVGPGEG